MKLLVPTIAALIVATACSSAESASGLPAAAGSQPMPVEAAIPTGEPLADDAVETAGSYVTLSDYAADKAAYDEGTVVLFFHASWCPTCKTTEENLNADPASIPEGLAIVKIDFDDSDDLRQRYGVTTQHTFVQVDADGNELAKWSGTLTAQGIDAQTV